jgi:hypothetical protein
MFLLKKASILALRQFRIVADNNTREATLAPDDQTSPTPSGNTPPYHPQVNRGPEPSRAQPLLDPNLGMPRSIRSTQTNHYHCYHTKPQYYTQSLFYTSLQLIFF